jgi:hypothetical protein
MHHGKQLVGKLYDWCRQAATQGDREGRTLGFILLPATSLLTMAASSCMQFHDGMWSFQPSALASGQR